THETKMTMATTPSQPINGNGRPATGCEMSDWKAVTNWEVPTWISLKKYRKIGLELRLAPTLVFTWLRLVCRPVTSEDASASVALPLKIANSASQATTISPTRPRLFSRPAKGRGTEIAAISHPPQCLSRLCAPRTYCAD